MAKKKYWQSFVELNDTEGHQKLAQNEFQELLPTGDAESTNLGDTAASRRDFLKYVGFSTAAAMAAASCETPVRKAIPYLNKPQDLVPGVADFYATTYVNGGEAIPIIAKVRDGRPIKLEGNTLSTFSKGGTNARLHASVLDLYDTARTRTPKLIRNGKETPLTLDTADKEIGAALASSGPVVLLTSTINSPTTKQIIGEFLAKYPGGRHVQFDAASYSGLLLASEAAYGRRAIPSYSFDKAEVIVSLGADFLGTWVNPIEFSKHYAVGRRFDESNPDKLSKHYQFESMLSLTGANADERFTHRPSETGAVAAALLSAVQGQSVSGVDGANLSKGIKAAADKLNEKKGRGLVVSGSNNTQVQLIVAAINEAIGANGTTINWAAPLQTHQGIDSEMETLVADMASGRVGSLIIYGVNPSYEYHNAAAFDKAIKSVKVSISLNDRADETTALCQYAVPTHHFLESWGDAEPKAGYISLLQPTINPLFQTRQFQDSLLKWSGNPTPYEQYFRNIYISKLGGLENFNKALQDGVIEPATAPTGGAAFNGAAVAAAVGAVAGLKKTSKTEVVIYQKVSLGDGKLANNPWLQELPDPITKATWDNYAIVSPQFAKAELKIDLANARSADQYEVQMIKPVLKLNINNKTLELPIIIVPGTQENTIAIAVGYGRKNVGRAANGVGQNAYSLLSYNGATVDWSSSTVSVSGSDAKYKVGQTQTHSSYEGRHEVIKEITIDEFKKNKFVVVQQRESEIGNFGGIENYEKEGSLYPVYDRPGIKWGMSIDLGTCIGCGSCSVACTVENNVPVVGKNEVIRFHDMHWMRIDRYFSGNPHDSDGVQTIFQPMLCQHCDNAPCENVCPVAATNHSSEGINQMAYNRCIGTRYCANNCPFKVRRFNWSDYTGADSFKDNQLTSGVGALNEAVFQMNDDLTRMVLNPDVTVRSRGVMEKCTFCIQRTQEGKLKAKKENRVLADEDVKTACQQACPTDAIVFGNANNPQSEISQVRKNNSLRNFYSLEQIHVLPNVNYLTKVRNTNVLAAHEDEAAREGAEHGSPAKAEH
ncbi:MAG: TAT-variant-translocated molybdopterin oxidoreductase [Chitinophagaceae bacterium]|nr:TAT-variant-translocated molybdopterin oxidoreductase [Chitinophagaceae bacterium]